MRTIAVASLKGGVGKTTTTINIAAELAAAGQRVLMVDMDPQGHLAEGFGISSWTIESDISDVLLRKKIMSEIIIEVRDRLHLAPSTIRLAEIQNELNNVNRREDRLKNALKPLKEFYDVCLIDCPPSKSVLITNALAAAQEVLIPISGEFFALYGVALVLTEVEDARRDEVNPTLKVLGIVATRQSRTIHTRDTIEKAKTDWPDILFFDNPVPELVAVRDSVAAGEPLREFAPKSAATIAYQKIAKEILK